MEVLTYIKVFLFWHCYNYSRKRERREMKWQNCRVEYYDRLSEVSQQGLYKCTKVTGDNNRCTNEESERVGSHG